MNTRFRAVVNANAESWHAVFPPSHWPALRELVEFTHPVPADFRELAPFISRLEDAEIIIGSWGAVPINEKVLDACPNLRLIAHAGGSVKAILTREVFDRNIPVTSSVACNALSVAEYCLGLILIAARNTLSWKSEWSQGNAASWWSLGHERCLGNYSTRIGLYEFGSVTKQLLKLLRPFEFDVYVASPYFGEAEARIYGATPATLDEIVETCEIISIHAADTPEHRHAMNRDRIHAMRPQAHLINTARPALVDENALIEAVEAGHISVYLDVLNQEPPAADHPLLTHPRALVSPHVAGSIGKERSRLGRFIIEEIRRLRDNRPLQGQVDLSTLSQRA